MSFDDKEKAALEMFKHYSNVRFLMLPLFFTAMGAIIFAYWTLFSVDSPEKPLLVWVAISGVGVSLLFGVYEYRLGETLYKVSGLFPETMAELKHKNHLGMVTLVTILLYLAPLFFWLWRICKHT